MNTKKLLENKNFRNNQNYIIDEKRKNIIIDNFSFYYKEISNFGGILFIIFFGIPYILYIIFSILNINRNLIYIIVILTFIIYNFFIKKRYTYKVYLNNIKLANKLLIKDDSPIMNGLILFKTNSIVKLKKIEIGEKKLKETFLIFPNEIKRNNIISNSIKKLYNVFIKIIDIISKIIIFFKK